MNFSGNITPVIWQWAGLSVMLFIVLVFFFYKHRSVGTDIYRGFFYSSLFAFMGCSLFSAPLLLSGESLLALLTAIGLVSVNVSVLAVLTVPYRYSNISQTIKRRLRFSYLALWLVATGLNAGFFAVKGVLGVSGEYLFEGNVLTGISESLVILPLLWVAYFLYSNSKNSQSSQVRLSYRFLAIFYAGIAVSTAAEQVLFHSFGNEDFQVFRTIIFAVCVGVFMGLDLLSRQEK